MSSSMSIEWGSVLPLILPVAGAALGYLLQLVWGMVEERRLRRLQLVNSSLQLLYGPLYSMNSVDDSAWETYNREAKKQPWDQDRAGVEAWRRRWFREAFWPIGQEREKVIKEQYQLIEPGFEAVFNSFIAHVESFRVLIAEWAEGDFSNRTPANSWDPGVKGDRRELTPSEAAQLKLGTLDPGAFTSQLIGWRLDGGQMVRTRDGWGTVFKDHVTVVYARLRCEQTELLGRALRSRARGIRSLEAAAAYLHPTSAVDVDAALVFGYRAMPKDCAVSRDQASRVNRVAPSLGTTT